MPVGVKKLATSAALLTWDVASARPNTLEFSDAHLLTYTKQIN
jgi:hypothetical protein